MSHELRTPFRWASRVYFERYWLAQSIEVHFMDCLIFFLGQNLTQDRMKLFKLRSSLVNCFWRYFELSHPHTSMSIFDRLSTQFSTTASWKPQVSHETNLNNPYSWWPRSYYSTYKAVKLEPSGFLVEVCISVSSFCEPNWSSCGRI